MSQKPYKQQGFPACVHLSIEFNQHAVDYESVEEWIAKMTTDGRFFYVWASEAERDTAIATGSIWTCQWYPDTPVGFHAVAASSFEALMTYVNESSAS
jgi:hypothetical protein